MLQLARAIVGVVSDLLSLLALFMRSSGAIRAENLILRRERRRRANRFFPDRARRLDRCDFADAMVRAMPVVVMHPTIEHGRSLRGMW